MCTPAQTSALCDRIAPYLPPAVRADFRDELAKVEQTATLAEPLLSEADQKIARLEAELTAVRAEFADLQTDFDAACCVLEQFDHQMRATATDGLECGARM